MHPPGVRSSAPILHVPSCWQHRCCSHIHRAGIRDTWVGTVYYVSMAPVSGHRKDAGTTAGGLWQRTKLCKTRIPFQSAGARDQGRATYRHRQASHDSTKPSKYATHAHCFQTACTHLVYRLAQRAVSGTYAASSTAGRRNWHHGCVCLLQKVFVSPPCPISFFFAPNLGMNSGRGRYQSRPLYVTSSSVQWGPSRRSVGRCNGGSEGVAGVCVLMRHACLSVLVLVTAHETLQ